MNGRGWRRCGTVHCQRRHWQRWWPAGGYRIGSSFAQRDRAPCPQLQCNTGEHGNNVYGGIAKSICDYACCFQRSALGPTLHEEFMGYATITFSFICN
jgi:hypothetical protein